ncbi:MAG: response regulator, partial [Bacteroidetes bacterium]
IRSWTLEEKEFAASLADLVSAKYEALERDYSEKELNKARLRAEESDRLKTSLLANMSHELRTPMNSILGFSELMLNDSDDPEVIFYTKKIHGAGKRLMNTLQAILELADLEATRSKLILREVDLMKALTKILAPFQALASEKGLYLVTEFAQRIHVLADENLLKLVFQNLIDNAIKFTESGGITIETAQKEKDKTVWALLQIKDTGIGIASDDFERIFQEFRQASEGYNRRFEGTGLGLTLSSKMIRIMGGDITVESELGLGTIFSVWLPLVSVSARKKDRAVSVDEGNGLPPVVKVQKPPALPLILVVEDNDDNAEIVKLYLKSKYRIDRAPDGYTALQMADQKQYKAILLDINLGTGKDGLKIATELRVKKSYTKTPVIALTGYTMSEDKEKIMEAGCTHYIAKPFTKSELVGVLASALT